MATYELLKTGTMNVTNGSASIVGVSTIFLSGNVKKGDPIIIYASAGAQFGFIGADATDNLALTLDSAYEGATESGLSFSILRLNGIGDLGESVRRINQLVAQVESNAGLLGVSVDAIVDDIAGRATYDDEAAEYTILVLDCTGETGGAGRAAIYIMGTGGSADWQGPAYLTGSVSDVLTALGVNSITVSTSDPSGGVDGDLWFKVPA